jgi:hypothetical protein
MFWTLRLLSFLFIFWFSNYDYNDNDDDDDDDDASNFAIQNSFFPRKKIAFSTLEKKIEWEDAWDSSQGQHCEWRPVKFANTIWTTTFDILHIH